MNHIGATVLLPQSIVDRADIEEQTPTRSFCVGGLEKCIRRQIGDHQRGAALPQRNGCGHSIVASPGSEVLQRELLIQVSPRRVVVVDPEPRTRYSIVVGWRLDQ